MTGEQRKQEGPAGESAAPDGELEEVHALESGAPAPAARSPGRCSSGEPRQPARVGFYDHFSDPGAVGPAMNIERVRRFPPVPGQPDVMLAEQVKWPDLVRFDDGELLLLCIVAGRNHYFNHGFAFSRSLDGGRTWSALAQCYEPKSQDCCAKFMGLDLEGRVWINIADPFDAVLHPDSGQEGAVPWHTVACSEDRGRTWTVFDEIDAHSLPAFVMSNGEFVWRRRVGELVVLEVDEAGRPRFRPISEPNRFPSDEWDMVETRVPGTLVAILRYQSTSEYYYTTRSGDYGRTWSEPARSDIWIGPVPSQPRLRSTSDGTLICLYAERKNSRVMAVASHDDGHSWDTDHKVVLLDSRMLLNGDHGYPSATPVEGNRWLGAYYVGPMIFGTFLDTRWFRDRFRSVQLRRMGPVVDHRTVGYWDFDEERGDIIHDRVHNNYGHLVNVKRVPGALGRALEFNGEDGFAYIPGSDTLDVGRYFAVEARVKVADPKREQVIVEKGRDGGPPPYSLRIKDGRLIYRAANGSTTVSNGEIQPETWTHILFALQRGEDHYDYVYFYIDGRLDTRSLFTRRPTVPCTRADGVGMVDRPIRDGANYHNYRPRRDGVLDSLVIGMAANFLASADAWESPELHRALIENHGILPDVQMLRFRGRIDELALHEGVIDEARVRNRGVSRYVAAGSITSQPILRPAGATWGSFRAEYDAPAGTAITFAVMDATGMTRLRENIASGARLTGLEADTIRLRAELNTSSPGQTPRLHCWEVTWQG